MKRKTVLAVLFSLLMMGMSIPLASAVSNAVGTKCAKAGATAKSGSLSVKCVKVGKKLLWQKVATPTKAAPVLCVIGNPCAVGTKGPGGGIVFYDAGSTQSWGRYLEAAPPGWSGPLADPKGVWCNITDKSLTAAVTDVAAKSSLGVEIGKGKANTDLMVAGCTTGVGLLARAYKGAGKTDWYLPSRDELDLMYKYILSAGGFRSGVYWTSSEFAQPANAWSQVMYTGEPNGGKKFGWMKSEMTWVRPIRAF